jgi:hypothetical protein
VVGVSVATEPAVAVNAAVVAPAATVTDTGTGSVVPLLLETATTNPAVAAGLVSETEQVTVPPEATVPGLHAKPESTGGATTASENVFELPFRPAVSTAVASAVTVPAVAVKPALAVPAVTVTDAGTVTFVLSLARDTTAPPAGAARVRLTVQALEPGAVTLAGVHVTPLT